MHIPYKITDNVGVMTPTGKLDFTQRKILLATLDTILQEPLTHMILDFSQVPFMDSAGLALLSESSKRARAVNLEILIIHPQPYIVDLFTLTHMDQYVTWFDSLEESLRSTPPVPSHMDPAQPPIYK